MTAGPGGRRTSRPVRRIQGRTILGTCWQMRSTERVLSEARQRAAAERTWTRRSPSCAGKGSGSSPASRRSAPCRSPNSGQRAGTRCRRRPGNRSLTCSHRNGRRCGYPVEQLTDVFLALVAGHDRFPPEPRPRSGRASWWACHRWSGRAGSPLPLTDAPVNWQPAAGGCSGGLAAVVVELGAERAGEALGHGELVA